MTEPVVTQVNQVVINKMTQAQYDQITPSETELYLITDAESSVAIDNNTITKNQSNQIQTVGVLDQRSSTKLSYWTGTKEQYDAIAVKDSNTLYNVTDDTNGAILYNKTERIGQIVQSTIPLIDAGLHLLDGSVLQGAGMYRAFIDYMADLYSTITPIDRTFVQPTLTSNGTMGGSKFAVSTSATQATDVGDTYGLFNENWMFHSVQNVTTGYIDFYNPVPINVTNIQFRNQNNSAASNRASSAGKIYGSNDGTSWTELTSYTNTVQTYNQVWNVSLSSNTNYYKYYRIDSTAGGSGGYWTIEQLTLTATYRTTPCFCTEEEWQVAVSTYGVCGKFVYDSVNNTIRLPKIAGFTEGAIDPTTLGDLTEAGLPNITGNFAISNGLGFRDDVTSGAFKMSGNTTQYFPNTNTGYNGYKMGFDASRSSSVYGNSSTVQPQSIKVLYYIVVATSTKTDIQVDIDEIATDLNGKMDIDMSNMNASQSAKNTIVGWGLPDYTARIIISTGSYTPPSDGLIIVSGGDNNQNKYINVNGARAAGAWVASSTSTDIMAFVQKGDSVTTAGSGVDVYFYPLKGAV